jgi:hypothetical protein
MGMLRNHRIPVLITAEEKSRLDEMRGSLSRGAFIRSRVFGPAPMLSMQNGSEIIFAPLAEQDEAGATIEVEPPPAPKEQLVLPPEGKADAQGWLHTFEPKGKDTGTLVMICIRPGSKFGVRYEVDLIGVELEPQADGSTVLRYGDRTLVRTGGGE